MRGGLVQPRAAGLRSLGDRAMSRTGGRVRSDVGRVAAGAPALVVQHVAAETAGAIGASLHGRGIDLDIRRMFGSDVLPTGLADHEALVIMGGPMSAASDEGFPWRGAELRLVREALDCSIPCLGVCLGAQIIAMAGGAECFAGPAPEIGWAPIWLTADAGEDPLFRGLSGEFPALHWHGDTFSLPVGAVHLARSEAYRNQGFRVGERAWGLQCHLEVDDGIVNAMVDAFGDQLDDAADCVLIKEQTPRCLDRLRPTQQAVFNRFADLVVGG